jgi:ubiquitin-like 1-activating enzyme E1 A
VFLINDTDEIALYDRQIRLWGVQAQEKCVLPDCEIGLKANVCIRRRLRTANILLVSIRALANEIAKNLVLAGIGQITIIDHEVVTPDDLCSQFLISEANIGQNASTSDRYEKL